MYSPKTVQGFAYQLIVLFAKSNKYAIENTAAPAIIQLPKIAANVTPKYLKVPLIKSEMRTIFFHDIQCIHD